jgi:uncharacterized OB-fold protein
MNTNLTVASNGSAYGSDALPFRDMPETAAEPPFETQNGVVLLRGSMSRSSGSKAFPVRQVCLETGSRDMEPMTFGPRGTLYSFSTVHVSSTRKTPYTLGYVDFENGVRVLCQVDAEGQELRCDQPVELRSQGERWCVVPAGTQHHGANQ